MAAVPHGAAQDTSESEGMQAVAEYIDSNQIGCQVWAAEYIPPLRSVSWEGMCLEGFAHGIGTLRWLWRDGPGVKEEFHHGMLTKGRKIERWTEQKEAGTYSGSYNVPSQRDGDWLWCGNDKRGHIDTYLDGVLQSTKPAPENACTNQESAVPEAEAQDQD